MKTFIMLIVALFGVILCSKGQVITKVVVVNNLKYLNAINFAFSQIQTLPLGKEIGSYWTSDTCTYGTRGIVINDKVYLVSVEKMKVNKDGSVVSSLTYFVGDNNPGEKFYALEILHYSFLHQTSSGWISMLSRENTASSFSPVNDDKKIVKIFDKYTGELGKLIK